MTHSLKIFLAVVFGILSASVLVIFYQYQRDFTTSYKQVMNQFHTIRNLQDNLTYNLLQTSMFAYNNQDNIANEIAQLQHEQEKLRAEPILGEGNYKSVQQSLKELRQATDKNAEKVELFLMLNAGFKNSYVFINTYINHSHELFDHDAPIHNRLHMILNAFSNAKKMLDIGYINQVQREIGRIRETDYSNKQQQQFITTFLTHADFISKNAHDYYTLLNELLRNEPSGYISKARDQFAKAARNDVSRLDQLAFILLLLLILSFGIILYQLIRSHAENLYLKQLSDDLQYSLHYDALTKLLNRISFEHRLESMQAPTLLLINIDRFKHINDFYGTRVGDAILREFADAIQLPSLQKYSPHYFRLGGDDFGVLFDSIDEANATRAARAIAASISSTPFIISEFEIYTSATIAVNAVAPILENADIALKHLKANHSDSIIIYREELGLQEQLHENIEMMQLLKTAIDHENIVPFFQPIVHLGSGEIEKYEALVRLRKDDGTILPPAAFLDVASKTLMYQEMTRIMIRKTFERFANLRYRFSINLSMRDLVDPSITSILRRELQNNPDVAKRLDIELLESESLQDLKNLDAFLYELKSYGCQISIDDFGSGYSNFAYITTLPIDTLKIDGSLVSKITTDVDKLSTVKTIVRFAEQLELQTVAEFVENAEIAEILKAMGVTYGQGYYFAKPSETLAS